MKRYRIANFDFDVRANFLTRSTNGWSQKAKDDFAKQVIQIKAGIIQEYGVLLGNEKIKRFIELGIKPFSILAYHNSLLDQIRKAYIQGAFYPALTSSCTLGERILNHLILDLRNEYDDFKEKPDKHPCSDCKEFKDLRNKGLVKVEYDIYSCKDCSNWKLMINELSKWGVFNDEVKQTFKKLSKKRHKSIHFNEKTITKLKQESLETIKLLQKIIQKLFPAFGSEYFIPAKGEAFLKKELESKPFFKKYYIPNSKLVSPYHKVRSVKPNFIIDDIQLKDYKEISDKEFIKLREDFQKKGILPQQ
ncbi:MAG: hypothetical protein V3V78_02320 [Candidatus Woesearchaeota archaeon]